MSPVWLLESPFVAVTIDGTFNSLEGRHMVIDWLIELGLDIIIFVVEIVVLVVVFVCHIR